MRIISDCNTVFIAHMLAAAAGLLRRVARHHQLRQLLPCVHGRAGAAALSAFQSVATLLVAVQCPDEPIVV